MIGKLMRAVRHIWRSSITGRFVSKAYAKKHGDTTVEETLDEAARLADKFKDEAGA